jgi:hypothetical protein
MMASRRWPSTACRSAQVPAASGPLHFPAKEDVLFAGGRDLLDVAVAAVAGRATGEPPRAALVRAIRAAVTASDGDRDPRGDLEPVRLRLITSVPALRATLLHRVFTAQQELAAALRAAYPDQLDELDAAALVGAVVGAVLAVGHAAVTAGQPLHPAIERVLSAVPTRGSRPGTR